MSNLEQGKINKKNEQSQEKSFFSDADNKMWEKILKKQILNLQNKAHPIFLSNFEDINLSVKKIPNLQTFNADFFQKTGWKIVPVEGLLKHQDYFELLKNRRFPAAMIMRTENTALLIKDPDIFHEIFGHCTMLLDKQYADFMLKFAKLSLAADVIDRALIARLLWFTTETGLVQTENGLKIFGSSILSSYQESHYSLASQEPLRKPFNLVEIFREPYRADILQKTYFIMENLTQLYDVLDHVDILFEALETARELGEYPCRFPITADKYSNIGHCYTLKELAQSK